MKTPTVIKPKKVLYESDIEKMLVKRVKEAGGQAWKFVSPNNRGVSDRIILINGKVWFVEIKRDGGKLTELQESFRRKVAEAEGNYFLVVGENGLNQFMELVNL